ncbi:4-hydroxybenzoate octaprenyltransferase [Prosthecomicrobium pneumaticum]|uniref:4-hydroxybenzoate octaprenyltransferase n=1 Tax=Prosthecomicrobium pneumaticum TaxID=81895 RepID=A0A7W9CVG3_9HYPH|nr:4-hydroxybenzoate octaprenyltransferase [Prosthecomicrobium pneumaticum]MBB5752102.1 4-hydroxybenzoate polyprenyltransferase [Prosthecomicrobium pneumaticum]
MREESAIGTGSGTVADADRGNLIDRFAPAWLRPYGRLARWDRPIGWWLLLIPCWWSAALAAIASGARFPDPVHLLLFFIGAVAMRGAGCTWNDIVDRDLDARVARTRSRPIPSGQVTVGRAKAFLVLQAAIGLVVLLQFNLFAIVLGASSLLVVALYPFMKRLTDWPQSVLGLAFSWGALMGWAAAYGSLDWAPLFLYAGGVAWTIGYDTIYALQDIEDDAIVGVRSTARLFGARAPFYVGVFYTIAVLCFGAALIAAEAGPLAWSGLFLAAAHLAWQARRIDIDDPVRALALFKSNRVAGLVFFALLLADAAF